MVIAHRNGPCRAYYFLAAFFLWPPFLPPFRFVLIFMSLLLVNEYQ